MDFLDKLLDSNAMGAEDYRVTPDAPSALKASLRALARGEHQAAAIEELIGGSMIVYLVPHAWAAKKGGRTLAFRYGESGMETASWLGLRKRIMALDLQVRVRYMQSRHINSTPGAYKEIALYATRVVGSDPEAWTPPESSPF